VNEAEGFLLPTDRNCGGGAAPPFEAVNAMLLGEAVRGGATTSVTGITTGLFVAKVDVNVILP
jgi:hypothetical protein